MREKQLLIQNPGEVKKKLRTIKAISKLQILKKMEVAESHITYVMKELF